MSTNPYRPPTSDVAVEPPSTEVPDEIVKKIKGAWVAGAISGCMTLVITLVAIAGSNIAGFNAWSFLDVILIFGLAYGIYRKSRICAVSMFIYFVISKILIYRATGQFSGAVMSIIFIYCYAQGIAGTFAYQKFTKE